MEAASLEITRRKQHLDSPRQAAREHAQVIQANDQLVAGVCWRALEEVARQFQELEVLGGDTSLERKAVR